MHTPQSLTAQALALAAVQRATAQLQAAQAAYWQAIADATAQGLSLRTVAAHSTHTYAALSRRGLANQHTSKG